MSKLEKSYTIDGIEVELEAEYEYVSIYSSWSTEKMYLVTDSGTVLGSFSSNSYENKIRYEETK